MEQRKWQGKTGGGIIGQKAILWLFRLFPLSIMYGIMGFVILFYLLFARKGRNAIFHYFRLRQGFTFWKSVWYTYKNHYSFGQLVLDRFAVYVKGSGIFTAEIDGKDHFTQVIDSSQGCVLVSAHAGNYELFGYLLSQNKKKINALTYDGEASVVQAERVKKLMGNNVNLIPLKEDMSHLFIINNALGNGDFISLFGDRSFGKAKNSTAMFLQSEALFPLGPYLLAEQFNVPLLAIFAMKTTATKFKVFIRPITCDPNLKQKQQRAKALLESYVNELEKINKLYPEQWYNYYEFWNR